MKNKFTTGNHRLIHHLNFGFLTRLFLCLLTVAGFTAPARASDFRRSALVLLSDPDPLLSCPGGFTVLPENAQAEPYIAVNPANPKHIVAVWIGARAKATIGAVTFDGGERWQQVVIPGVAQCTGGPAVAAGDPWVSIAPNGDVYVSSMPFFSADNLDLHGIAVSKSGDGGLHWGSPVILDLNTDPRFYVDHPSITAHPKNQRLVFAAWSRYANGNRGAAGFSRSTDAGQTWEPAREIYSGDPSSQVAEPTIVVLPNGTVLHFFIELPFANGKGGKDGFLSVARSFDNGQTWSAPSRVARVSATDVKDPETGQSIPTTGSYPPFFSVAVDGRTGQLYAVWEDLHFSGGQYPSIAFAMSGDGGFTWSTPITVNQTPGNIAVGNRQAFMPSVAVAADGTIGVSYYDFRNNTPEPGLPTDYWLVHCHPSLAAPATNPANWKSETRLTEAPFNLEDAVNAFFGLFLGDYMGLAAAGNDFVAIFTQAAPSDPDSMYFRRAGP